MERELWSAVYQLTRECEDFHYSRVEVFFRFDDRGGVFLGNNPRSASVLGL